MGVFRQLKKGKNVRRGREIGRTEEFKRILRLPRRTAFKDYSDVLTSALKTENGEQTLRANQAWALTEACEQHGLVFIAPVGEGKTLVSFLLGAVWEVPWVLVIMPANAIEETKKKKIPEARKHWDFPEIEIISYETLAQSGRVNYLDELRPPAIICDEVHKLRRKNTARKRIVRYLVEHDIPFAGLTGTLTENSIKDYSHTMAWALGDGSPVPRTSDVEEWADLLDDGIPPESRPDRGAFEDFCRAGEQPRQAYRRLLMETPGVVMVTNPTSIGSSLVIQENSPTVPKKVVRAIEKMRRRWMTPSDDVIMTGIEFAAHAKELALGFYYRWKWPDGKPDFDWLEARSEWRSYVRHVIRYHNRGEYVYDTEKQVRLGVEQGRLFPNQDQYNKWFSIADRWDVEALKETVWISDFAVKHGLRWLEQADKRMDSPAGKAARTKAGILWVGHKAMLKAFEEQGVPVYGGGNSGILDEKRSCVASLQAHSEAKNLQYNFSQNYYMAIPANGYAWTQSLGRTHRTGQNADEVVAEVALQSIELWESFQTARRRTGYQKETTIRQKLDYAQINVSDENEVVTRVQSKDPMWCKELDWDRTDVKGTP